MKDIRSMYITYTIMCLLLSEIKTTYALLGKVHTWGTVYV